MDGGIIINCPGLPVPLVGVGKLIIGSVFHTWMLKRAPAGVNNTTVSIRRIKRINGDQKDPWGSKGSTGIKRINGYQGSHGSHTGINQGLIFESIWAEMGRRGSDWAETRGK